MMTGSMAVPVWVTNGPAPGSLVNLRQECAGGLRASLEQVERREHADPG